MSIVTSKRKVTIIRDDKPFVSFNAYNRPKRRSNDFKKPKNVRIVNLDPTDDPEKVCEAYRQIRIKEQEERIAKNKARLAEKRRLAEIKAAKEAAKKAERLEKKKKGIARAAKSRGKTAAAIEAKARQKNIESILLSGKAVHVSDEKRMVDLNGTKFHRCHLIKTVTNLRSFGHDIVSVTSTGGRGSKNLFVSIWTVDRLKRPTQKLNKTYTTSVEKIKQVLLEALQQGLIVKASDIQASKTTIAKSVRQLRGEGWKVCIVKNGSIDAGVRGWVIPCKGNGLEAG